MSSDVQGVETPLERLYVIRLWAISRLEGKVLTLIDAAIADPVQRKALKDFARPLVWEWIHDVDQTHLFDVKRNSII